MCLLSWGGFFLVISLLSQWSIENSHSVRSMFIIKSLASNLWFHTNTWIVLYVIITSCPSFRVNPHSIVCLNVKKLLTWSRRHIWSISDKMIELCCEYLICTVHVTVCYYHVTYKVQSESTLYSLPKYQGTPCSKQAPCPKWF